MCEKAEEFIHRDRANEKQQRKQRILYHMTKRDLRIMGISNPTPIGAKHKTDIGTI